MTYNFAFKSISQLFYSYSKFIESSLIYEEFSSLIDTSLQSSVNSKSLIKLGI